MPKKILKLQAIPGKQFLQTEDGQDFRLLADTWWYGLSTRWSDQEFEQAAKQRKEQGFTAIQLVLGVPPEIPFWSSEAHNQGGHPFLTDYSPNLEYFAFAKERIVKLIEIGLTPIIYGNWGYHIDLTGVEKMKHFWERIVAEYHDLPVIYCVTGEVDLFPPLGYFQHGTLRKYAQSAGNIIKKFARLILAPNQYQQNQRLKMWAEVAQHIKSLDPKTPLTIHPHTQLSASQLFQQPQWLDIDTIQSGHSSHANKTFSTHVKQGHLHQPFIDLEAPYEGIFDHYYGPIQSEQAKQRVEQGSAGYVYGAQGLWNLNQTDQPLHTHWGNSTWREALSFPGSSLLHTQLHPKTTRK